jgi:hypothetical protein
LNELAIWTVYKYPLDYPDKYVARKFLVGKGTVTATSQVLLGSDLKEVRRQLPMGLLWQDRQFLDPLQVVETWM